MVSDDSVSLAQDGWEWAKRGARKAIQSIALIVIHEEINQIFINF